MALFLHMENRRTLKRYLGGSRKHERRPWLEACKKNEVYRYEYFLCYLTRDDESELYVFEKKSRQTPRRALATTRERMRQVMT